MPSLPWKVSGIQIHLQVEVMPTLIYHASHQPEADRDKHLETNSKVSSTIIKYILGLTIGPIVWGYYKRSQFPLIKTAFFHHGSNFMLSTMAIVVHHHGRPSADELTRSARAARRGVDYPSERGREIFSTED